MKRLGESFNNTPEKRPGINEISGEIRWKALVRNGLYPDTTSMEDYDLKVTERLQELRKDYLEKVTDPYIDPETAKSFHLYIFQDVHPWAGRFRQGSETVMIGVFPGSDPGRVNREMDIWAFQTKELLNRSRTELDVLQAIAFSHVKFERIHPFKDGNGRTGRCLLNKQCIGIYGPKPERLFDRSSYLSAMQTSSADLYPLMLLLALREGMEPPPFAPYPPKMRVAPFFHLSDEMTLQEDLAAAILPPRKSEK